MVKADADDKLDWVMGHINHPITEILQIPERTETLQDKLSQDAELIGPPFELLTQTHSW